MPLVLRRTLSAGARPRQGRTSSGLPALRGLHLDRACAPAFHGSYGEPGTTKISLTQVSTLSGDTRTEIVTVHGQTVHTTVTITALNEPVHIAPPPAGQTATRPGL